MAPRRAESIGFGRKAGRRRLLLANQNTALGWPKSKSLESNNNNNNREQPRATAGQKTSDPRAAIYDNHKMTAGNVIGNYAARARPPSELWAASLPDRPGPRAVAIK